MEQPTPYREDHDALCARIAELEREIAALRAPELRARRVALSVAALSVVDGAGLIAFRSAVNAGTNAALWLLLALAPVWVALNVYLVLRLARTPRE